jgi:glycine betaine/proline transport system substrate-binding protein
MFKKLSFTPTQIGAMAALVDEDGMTQEDAGIKWLTDNKNVWTPWTK